MGGRLIGPGKNEFIQAQVQRRHARTPEGKLMSTKQKVEVNSARHPPTKFVYQNNVRTFGSARHITN